MRISKLFYYVLLPSGFTWAIRNETLKGITRPYTVYRVLRVGKANRL